MRLRLTRPKVSGPRPLPGGSLNNDPTDHGASGSPKALLLGTNWKMTKTICQSLEYMREVLKLIDGISGAGCVQLFVIPSHTAISAVRAAAGQRLWVGAQNMHWAAEGAYTGEVSGAMLKELGVDLVELGHSERRQYFGETDSQVNRKVLHALELGIRPLVCVGESMEERDAAVGAEAVIGQAGIALRGVRTADASRVIVAYEPHWSIGTAGVPASADYVREVCSRLREALGRFFDPATAVRIPLLYGGSVSLENASDLLNCGPVDGLFVGRTAWQPAGFAALIEMAIRRARALGLTGRGTADTVPDA
jgi:L-erythrulose 1-phosphate isomerase